MLQKFYEVWKSMRVVALAIGIGVMAFVGSKCSAHTLEIEYSGPGSYPEESRGASHEQEIRDSLDRAIGGTANEKDIGNVIEAVERGILNNRKVNIKIKKIPDEE